MNFSSSESNAPPRIDGDVGGLQPSIYSLTFGELQSTMGGLGKEFGSMNMDELVRNIWGSEDIQTKASVGKEGAGAGAGFGYFQKQGSLTLPRTMSQKTVEDVLKDITKEYAQAIDDVGPGGGGSHLLQKQQTLKEMTLEEFLVKAGAVREETIYPGNQSNQIPILSTSMSHSQMNGNGVGSNQQPKQQQQQHSFAFSKQPTEGNGSQMPLSSITRLGHIGIANQGLNNGVGHGIGRVGLGAAPIVTAANAKGNQLISDGVGRNNRYISTMPYSFNGSVRGRRSSGAVEKVAERRQKRMIKNRESAARSRARKQAYTTELEAEVAKLKEENEELQKKQAEIMESEKNQVADMQSRPKKLCLRRTQTGPW